MGRAFTGSAPMRRPPGYPGGGDGGGGNGRGSDGDGAPTRAAPRMNDEMPDLSTVNLSRLFEDKIALSSDYPLDGVQSGDSWHPSDPQLTRRRRAKAGPRASPPPAICLLCRVCVVCGGGVADPRLWRALEALSARVRPAAPRCARILPKGDRPVDASPDRCAA